MAMAISAARVQEFYQPGMGRSEELRRPTLL